MGESERPGRGPGPEQDVVRSSRESDADVVAGVGGLGRAAVGGHAGDVGAAAVLAGCASGPRDASSEELGLAMNLGRIRSAEQDDVPSGGRYIYWRELN